MPNVKNVTSPSDRITLSNAVLYLYNGTALTSPPVYNALPATWPAELSNDEQMANLLRALLGYLHCSEIMSWGTPVIDDLEINFLEDMQIDPEAWVRGDINWKYSEIEHIKFYKDPYIRSYLLITLDLKQFRSLFHSQPKEDSIQTEKKRGRKTTYDWEAFYAEIAVRADLDNLPETQAQLENDMASWCLREWGKEPVESMLRLKISPIYNHPRRAKGR
jgi:hypothetical protein